VDVGAGFGFWAIEIARDYPNARVVGTDISPVPCSDAPPNCTFSIESLFDGLSFLTGSVDILHSMGLLSEIPASKWSDYLAESYRVLKPGTGSAMFVEGDPRVYSENNTIPPNSELSQWMNALDLVHEARKNTMIDPQSLESLVMAQPFVKVNMQHWRLPVNTWPQGSKQAGKHALAVVSRVVALADPFIKPFFNEFTDKEHAIFNQRVQRQIRNPAYHLYFNMYCITARKPKTI